jgi:hypothetical protein
VRGDGGRGVAVAPSAPSGFPFRLKLFLGAAAVLAVAWLASLTARKSQESGTQSAAGEAASGVKFFDAGFAVGPAREIEKVLRSSTAGTRTACEEPAPSPDERMRWNPHEGPLAALSMADLLERSDSDLCLEVDSRLLDTVYGAGYAAMSREEQNVYVVSTLEDEIINGGLDQYFVNSSGNCAMRTLAALGEMGLFHQHEAFMQALALFPDASASEDRSTRFDQLEVIGHRRDAWGRLDDAFEGVSGSRPVADYIRRHASAFALPPHR